jgi:hypothetical protein
MAPALRRSALVPSMVGDRNLTSGEVNSIPALSVVATPPRSRLAT